MQFKNYTGMNGSGTVLVVDDEPAVLAVVRRMLEATGFEVRCFLSAREFLDGRPFARPTCLILDLLLPDQSGLELQEVLMDKGLTIPIIFLTGFGDVPSTVQAMKAGAMDFLQKPIQVTELVGAVRRALARDRMASQDDAQSEALSRCYRALTQRQREVFDLVAAGLTNKEIASCMGVSEKTVKAHRGQVMIKMKASSLADLVRMALKLGIRD